MKKLIAIFSVFAIFSVTALTENVWAQDPVKKPNSTVPPPNKKVVTVPKNNKKPVGSVKKKAVKNDVPPAKFK